MSGRHRRSARATAARLATGGGSRARRSDGRGRRGASQGSAGRPAGPRGSRGGRRPRLTRRAAAPPPGSPPPGRDRAGGRPRRPGLTTRAAVLALVVCGVVLGLAYPFRTHLAQQAELERLTAEAEQRAARVAGLEADIARWDDPSHVEAEARRRLGYVHPGETLYRVIDPTAAAEADEQAPTPGVPPLRVQAPWWSQLWHSAQGTDAAPVRPDAPTR